MTVNFEKEASSWLVPLLEGFTSENGKFKIRIQGFFESSHYLYSYFPDGSDEPIHGHTWQVEVFLMKSDGGLNENGISYDFLSARKRLDDLLDRMDHICINDLPEFKKINPTSENIAKWFYRGLMEDIQGKGKISEIRIHEGPTNYA
ncbi:MAG: 6-carboxytetrahydropterin synthase, partial [Spirochaetia bacterium]|nr:6-carboxytetrahydropterin synthase [Spirochaetia bacterium]